MTTTKNTATDKQVRFTMSLLDQAGFNTRFMDKHFSKLGATMRQRSGRTADWVASLSVADCSRLIETLKGMS